MSTSTVKGRTVAAVAPTRARAVPVRKRRRDHLAGYAFMAPFLVLFALFLVWPVWRALVRGSWLVRCPGC